MKHAGIHWPENAGGEHPNRETIAAMPGIAQGCCLICSPSARYHYDYLRQRSPLTVWRAIPRQGKLPAQLDWDAGKVADECLNLWDEQPHYGTEWFLPLNELQFPKESGENWRGYGYMAARLGALRVELRSRFKALGQDVRLMMPAWVPGDDLDQAGEWVGEARRWDVVCLHAYGQPWEIDQRYWQYRTTLGPGYPIFVGEWNANHTGADERTTLEAFADIAQDDPYFMGATYFIWETRNPGEGDLSIYGYPEREALFADPPGSEAPAPIPEPEPIPMPANPWEHYTAEQIAAVTGAPIENVTDGWPRIVEQLGHCGITEKAVQKGVIITVAIETASTFAPVREAYWMSEAWRQANLRYWPYYGRGFVQRTWIDGYRSAGPKIAELWGAPVSDPTFDLVANPDNLLDPDMAAADLAIFFRDTRALPSASYPDGYSLVQACRDEDWRWLRILVQGGTAGLDRAIALAGALEGRRPVAFDPTHPAHPQDKSYDCSQESLEWAFGAVGRKPQDAWMTQAMIAQQVMSPDLGLLDASGAGLSAFIQREWGEFGYFSNFEPTVSFDFVAAEIGPYPLLVGGRHFGSGGHWVGVRGYDPEDDKLLLANPAHGYTGIYQEITREQWDARGPWSMVRLLHPDLLSEAA